MKEENYEEEELLGMHYGKHHKLSEEKGEHHHVYKLMTPPFEHFGKEYNEVALGKKKLHRF